MGAKRCDRETLYVQRNPELTHDDREYVAVGYGRAGERDRLGRKDYALLRRVDGRGTVRTAYSRGVQRDAPRGGIEMQLHGIVTRLAMNVNGSGKPGGLRVVQPPVVGLPTVGCRDQHDLAAAGVVQLVSGKLSPDKHLGATRPAIDNGWMPDTCQIGLTGKIVTPDLYIAIALSGATQHMAGCSGAKTIVAINRDPNANIFREAHYGVVGDWNKVLPAFTEKIRELLGEKAD